MNVNDSTVGRPSDFQAWHFSSRDLAGWEANLRENTIPPRLEAVFGQCFDNLALLLRKQESLNRMRERLPKGPSDRAWTEVEKHQFFEATESFFQTYYASISSLASVVARHSSVFGSAPIEKMARFLGWLERRYGLDHLCKALELARSFRAMLDHPQSYQPYIWAFGYGNAPAHIFLYGTASQSGAIPDLSIPADSGEYGVLPDGNWTRTAPDDAVVVDALGFYFGLVMGEVVRGTPRAVDVPFPIDPENVGVVLFSPSTEAFSIPHQLAYRWPPLDPGTPGIVHVEGYEHPRREPGSSSFSDAIWLLRQHSSELANDLGRDNDTRALLAVVMATELPLCIEALDELRRLLADVERYGAAADQSPVREIASRLSADFSTALDGLLVGNLWAVLEPCGDLMDIAMLAHHFRLHPELVERWTHVSDSDRVAEFGFLRLIGMVDEGDELPFIGTSRQSNTQEYIAHMRSRELAMWTTSPEELSRGKSRVEADRANHWVRTMSAEIIRHVAGAGIEVLRWLCTVYPDSEPADFKMPESNGAIKTYLAEHDSYLDATVDHDKVTEMQAKYDGDSR